MLRLIEAPRVPERHRRLAPQALIGPSGRWAKSVSTFVALHVRAKHQRSKADGLKVARSRPYLEIGWVVMPKADDAAGVRREVSIAGHDSPDGFAAGTLTYVRQRNGEVPDTVVAATGQAPPDRKPPA